MKVKAIDIFGHRHGQPYAEHVEQELQAWLRDNQSAKIEHVLQTPTALAATTHSLIVTIFYRD